MINWYAFQCSIHSIWREKNGRKHGKTHQPWASLLKFIDKEIRNRISSLQMGGSRKFSKALESGLIQEASEGLSCFLNSVYSYTNSKTMPHLL